MSEDNNNGSKLIEWYRKHIRPFFVEQKEKVAEFDADCERLKSIHHALDQKMPICLLGLSGISNDLREILAAAEQGNARARLALEVFVDAARHWIGAFFLALNGCDALVFTAGIGENCAPVRAAICAQLDQLGLVLDPARNAALRGEGEISAAGSRVKVYVIPANEELVVARETLRCISTHQSN